MVCAHQKIQRNKDTFLWLQENGVILRFIKKDKVVEEAGRPGVDMNLIIT